MIDYKEANDKIKKLKIQRKAARSFEDEDYVDQKIKDIRDEIEERKKRGEISPDELRSEFLARCPIVEQCEFFPKEDKTAFYFVYRIKGLRYGFAIEDNKSPEYIQKRLDNVSNLVNSGKIL